MEVFLLKTQDENFFRPATQATILAKYSRSPESARDISRDVNDNDADVFTGKWVVNYGHSSVAELATVPICFENVSMVASKFIESFPRAGYSEKSTRYQKFSRSSFVSPPNFPETARKFVNRFYDAYDKFYEPMLEIVLRNMKLDDTESNRKLAKVKARVFDNLRYLLPAGTGTNLAAVMNLRDIRYLVSQGRASKNPEIREIAEKTFAAVSRETPSLLREANPDLFHLTPKILCDEGSFSTLAGAYLLSNDRSDSVQDFKKNCYTYYGLSWQAFSEHMNNRGMNPVPDIFKTVKLTFLLVMDYGAFRDLQRHRRCEQFNELLTPYVGFEIPDDIKGTTIEKPYVDIMESVHNYEDEALNDPELFQYVIPMGFLHRSIFQMDLKELYYISELRTKPQGHISYRRIAYNMHLEATRIFPELMQWCRAINPTEIGDHL